MTHYLWLLLGGLVAGIHQYLGQQRLGDHLANPPLPELIAACGERHQSLKHVRTNRHLGQLMVCQRWYRWVLVQAIAYRRGALTLPCFSAIIRLSHCLLTRHDG
jgi:hypothetical protein